MRFELFPTVDIMLNLYRKPGTTERFGKYLQLLQGDSKDDLAFPVMGFNPMAKEHITEKLLELKALNAEELMREALSELNEQFANIETEQVFKVALNLSDDLKGGWTNRYTSDYDSKFKLNALVKRGFCAPVFWSSETYTASLIQQHTKEYALRCIYWLGKPKPETLEEHIVQENFVAKNMKPERQDTESLSQLHAFFTRHRNTSDYSIIFNFLYGDEACKALGFPCYGIQGAVTGYDYAQNFPV